VWITLKRNESSPNYTLNNEKVKMTEIHKYLAIMLDNWLNFNNQVENIVENATKSGLF
jgi:hypothetical protein